MMFFNFNLKWVLIMVNIIIMVSMNNDWLMIKATSDGNNHYHDSSNPTLITVQLSSLLPSAHGQTCKPSPRGQRQGTSLEVRHKYGPCSSLKSHRFKHPTYEEIFKHDEIRVQSIRDRANPKKIDGAYGVRLDKQVNLPAKSGKSIGFTNFIVTIGIGTPRKDLTLVFDTGSDFTWTQCEPCAGNCYDQQDPIFDPSKSSTYSNISCNSPLCSDVRSATSTFPRCSSSSSCIYGIQYGDTSFSVGYFAKDTLYLGSQDTLPNFLFGCGQNNEGLFYGIAGLLGLGKNKLSVISQMGAQYGKYFSYCLPSRSTSTGHLTFGKGHMTGTAMQYTPLLGPSRAGIDPTLYFIDLQGITVGGEKLVITPTVFSTGGTIIDSGTVITRLPPDAYSAMRDAFTKFMSKFNYTKAPATGLLDTCYDFSGYSTFSVPKISLLFRGGAYLDLPINGILIARDISQLCLAFIGNKNAGDVGILGNLQQLNLEVVYDIAGGKLGFGPGNCA